MFHNSLTSGAPKLNPALNPGVAHTDGPRTWEVRQENSEFNSASLRSAGLRETLSFKGNKGGSKVTQASGAQACHPSTQEPKAGGAGVRGQPGFVSEKQTARDVAQR